MADHTPLGQERASHTESGRLFYVPKTYENWTSLRIDTKVKPFDQPRPGFFARVRNLLTWR